MQSQGQIVCSGCRSVLVYPRGGGATSVRCSFCNAITPVPLQLPRPGMGMAQLICGGCRTLLMHAHGATSVRCSCCQTVNLAPASNVAHVNCGNCRTTLMYPYGAPSVKCAVCHYITNVSMSNVRISIPMHQPSGAQTPAPMLQPGGTQTPAPMPSTSTGLPHSQTQTVVVENPMSLDKSGKLVSNVVVGVTTGKN